MSADMTNKDGDPADQTTRPAGENPGGAGAGKDAEASWSQEEIGQLIAEAEALAFYVSRHGDSLTDETLRNGLLDAIANAKTTSSARNWQNLMAAYARVTVLTYKERGVNGRTILDTQSKRSLNRPMVIGILLFVFALIFEILIQWRGGVSDPSKLVGISAFAYPVIGTLSTFLVPAFWGGIGACVFLTKRISDKLFNMAYEQARVRGDGTRIFLGAMLGVVIVVLFFPDFSDRITLGQVNLAPATAAFIAGLGVKPIYAGFESLSEELARRFKGRKVDTP